EGALCGVPERAGSFPFIVRAEDQAGLFDSALFILDVTSGSDFAISTTRLDDGAPGVPYSAMIAAVNGLPPYTFALVPGTGDIPPGLFFDPIGKISGSPTAEGLYSFAVEAR